MVNFFKIKETLKDFTEKFKNSKKELSQLEKAEFILDYTHNFSSKYMLYDNLTNWIKTMSFDDRMFYIINSCNKKNPTKKEQFLLAMAYKNLGVIYTEFAINYIKLYLSDNHFYNKKFKNCNTENDSINYQKNMFNLFLASKYIDDLEYDNALYHALIALNTPEPKWDNAYLIIATIYYKKNDYYNAISILDEGINKTIDYYKRKSFIEFKNDLIQKQRNGYIYKPRNKNRLRKDFKTGKLYDLTTGEIIE